MPTCQCPACQAQFQAAAGRGAFTACPECRFQVRVPELRQESPTAPRAGMITCECTKCRLKFQVPKDRAGTTQRCPECNQPVQVGVQVEESRPFLSAVGWLSVAAVGLAVFYFCCGCGLSILGKNANSAFGTVGASIGAVPGS